jgi:hypothetical protein
MVFMKGGNEMKKFIFLMLLLFPVCLFAEETKVYTGDRSYTGNFSVDGDISTPSTVVGTVSNLGTNLSSTCAINVGDGAVQTGTVTGDTEFTFSGWADSGYSKDVTLKLVNAGAHSLTWDSAIDWPAGSEPALTTSGTDILYFFSLDGGTTVIGSHCLPNVQ